MEQVASPTASQAVLGLITGTWVAQAVYVAAKLDIADRLIAGPQTSASLAHAAGAHPRALYRVLRALASVGIFHEDESGQFNLTPLAEPLRSDVPGSVRAFAVMMGSEWVWRSWGGIMHSVRTEEAAFEEAYGESLFQHYAKNPEAARTTMEGLTSRSLPENTAVVQAYDFSDCRVVVDMGGGQGTLLATILAANLHLEGILFEMPHVVGTAQQTFDKTGTRDRSALIGGDFFASAPSGGDLYIMKKVIHDWEDEQACTIIRHCRDVIPAQGRLLLIENIVPHGNDPSFSKLIDLLMMVYPGGRERTEIEYRDLLRSSGFTLNRVIPTTSLVSIIEAIPG
jgi:hypothetical protein